MPPPSSHLILPASLFPKERIIRAALEERLPGLREIERERLDWEVTDGWSLAAYLPGLPNPVFFWTEPLDPIPEEVWWIATDIHESEREALEECRFGLNIMTTLTGGGDPRQVWRAQLACAMDLADLSPAILDLSSQRIIPKALAQMIAGHPGAPPAFHLMSRHAIFDEKQEDQLWMHTHGLARAGIPDLEVFFVPDRHRELAADLLRSAADRLLDGTARVGETMEVASNLALEILPVEEALKHLDPNAVGGLRDRLDSHDEPRAALVLPVSLEDQGFSFFSPHKRNLRIDGVLESLSDQGRVLQTIQEIRRRTEQAVMAWPLFLSLWKQRAQYEWQFVACLVDRSQEEHVWLEVEELGSEGIGGRWIGSEETTSEEEPDPRPTLRYPPEDVVDFGISTPDGFFDCYHVVLLARQAGLEIRESRKRH